MQLKTLGELRLEGSDFGRAKPLLLATYLALEGARDRRHVAELFWPAAADHMKSLTVALAQARKAVPGILGADAASVWTELPVDAVAFLEHLEQRDAEQALVLYGGPFLAGIRLKGGEAELEEWVYATREVLAASARGAWLELAKERVAQGDFNGATQLAEKAYLLSGAPPAEPETLTLIHALLLAGGSVHAGDVKKEAADFGLSLPASKEAAHDHLKTAFETERPAQTSNLPTRNTSFVGRDLELTEVAGLLTNADTSLVTLVGPGGVGKTRLALQVAQEQVTLGAFRDGVYFVALETLASEQLLRALAESLGVKLKGEVAGLEPLIRAVGERDLLMVLDNFEQVLGGALQLPALLRACPKLKLLVTSRVRLSLEEEQVFPVGGLPFAAATALAPADAERLDAVNLFVRRAKRARPDFAVNETTLPPVLKICELVEGLPLGLELAAVWVKLMPVAEIAEELNQRLDLLATDLRNVPDRHRSIRSAFEYSWQRLTSKEQEVLAKLAVFRGGFRRVAASTVAGATLPVLASLVDKSLLRVSLEGHYDRHSLLYQFTREKLTERPAARGDLEARHARYYLQLLKDREAALKGPGQSETLVRLEEEAANISAAWRHAASHAWSGDLLNAATALKLFYEAHPRYQTGLEAFALGAAGLDETEPQHHVSLGNLLIHQADLAERLGHDDEAGTLAGRGLALLRPAGDLRGVSIGLNLLGALALNRAAHDEARACFEENLVVAERRQDTWAKRVALGNLAITEHHSGNIGAADARYKEVTELHRQAGDHVNVVRTLTNLGQLHRGAAQLQEAKRYFDEALRLANEQSTEATKPLLYMGLGSVAYERGDHAEAKTLLKTSYDLAKKAGDNRRAADSLAKLGKVRVLSGDRARGLSDLHKSLRLALETVTPFVILGVLTQVAEVSLADSPETAAKLACLVGGHPSSKTADKAKARLLLDGLENRFRPPVLSNARAWGKNTSPEAAAATLSQQGLSLLEAAPVNTQENGSEKRRAKTG